MRPFLIDTDTASDDAAALAMALRYPGISVEAITVVAGNVPLPHAVQNALYTVELCQSQVPVYAGIDRPLLRPLHSAENVHGDDGMGDIGLALTGRTPADGHAVDVIIELAHRFAGQLTLVTLGPLTNLAAALIRDPSIASLIPRCVVMGGQGDGPGNTSPVAEFNIHADPEAAAIVLASGLPLELVGWDVCRRDGIVNAADQASLRALGPVGAFCIDIQAMLDRYAREVSGLDGFDFADPVAMAVALEPALGTLVEKHVDVVWGNVATAGQFVIDWLESTGHQPNAHVCTRVDHDGFMDLLTRCYRNAPV